MQESPNDTIHFERSEEIRVSQNGATDFRSRLRSCHVPVYLNHFCSAWGDTAWLFTMGIFLVACVPGSLRLTAIHGFTCAGARLLLGTIVDHWTKRTNKLTVAYVLVIAHNTAVAVSTVTVAVVLPGQVGAQWTRDVPATTSAQCIIVVSSAVAGVASLGRQMSLKRDWAVSLPDRDVTTTMHWIDVCCRVVTPPLTGYLMTSFSLHFVAVCVALWSIVTVFVELFLFRIIYKSMPDGVCGEVTSRRDELNETSALLTSANDCLVDGTDRNTALGRTLVNVEENAVAREEKSATRGGCCLLLFDDFMTLWRGWGIYWNHNAAGAGLSLALLFFSVIRLDNIIVGFAKDRGMAEIILGTFVSGSVLLATLGDALLSPLRDKIGLRKTGLLAFVIIVSSLTLPIASLLVPGNTYNPFFDTTSNDDVTSGHMNLTLWWLPERNGLPSLSILLLVTGIALASFGVWLAEATAMSLLGEGSSGTDSDVTRRVQRSLNLLAQQAKWVLVLTLPWPRTFGLIVVVAFSCVFVAAGLFAFCTGGIDGRPRACNSLVFAVATQPQKRFAYSCSAPLNL